MTIHKNLWAGYETYFVRMGSSGRYATGISVVNVDGDWRVTFNAKYYASDLRHDKEHFPVVLFVMYRHLRHIDFRHGQTW